MHPITRLLLTSAALVQLAVSAPVLAQATLEERMTGQEFERAGLSKLTPEQLAYLNQWLEDAQPPATPPKRAAAAAAAPAPSTAVAAESATTDQRGLRPDERSRGPIEARIDGQFRGWSGKTRFKLDNGMVWQQVGSGEVRANSDSPKVTIEPKSLGSWKLYVEGVGRSVKVKRIK